MTPTAADWEPGAPASSGREPSVVLTTNRDLLPTAPAQRTATARDMAGLWICLAVGIPSYYIAGTLVEKGMAWYQGLAVVVAAKCVLLVPLIAASHPGPKYGLPFPVLARSAFGTRGAHLPSLLRSLIACGWFGIQTWFGGQSLLLLLPPSFTSRFSAPVPWLAASPVALASFAVFWLLELAAVWYGGMTSIRKLQTYSSPVLVLLSLLLLSWAYLAAGGFGPMLSLPPRLSPPQFWALFFPSLTANVGSWAAFALTIPDFTRFARSQADQALGQLGLPLFMGCFAFVGLAVTSASQPIFGRAISNPIDLLAAVGAGTWPMFVAVPGISLAILATNILANIVAPANTLVGLAPKVFIFRTAALAASLVGAVGFQPWRILSSADSFVYTWLVGSSAVMGPLTGVMLTDYYVLRRTELNVAALYSDEPDGEYYFYKGFNLVAVLSFAVSLAPIVPGFLHKVGMVESLPGVFVAIYNVSWFFGLLSAAAVYWVLSLCSGRGCGGGGKNEKMIGGKGCLREPLLLVVEGVTD